MSSDVTTRARDGRDERKPRGEKPKQRRVHSRAHGPLAFLERYKEPGYAYHFEADHKANLFYLLQDGWEFVLDESGAKVGLEHYGTDESGKSYPGFLMKIPQEDYDELYAATREEQIKETERGVEGVLHQTRARH